MDFTFVPKNVFTRGDSEGWSSRKNWLLLFLICLITNNFFAETNTEKFWNLWKNNTEEAQSFLNEWQKKNKKDPELYICYFNMYITQASKEQMHVESFLPENFNGQYMEGQNENGDKIFIYSICIMYIIFTRILIINFSTAE